MSKVNDDVNECCPAGSFPALTEDKSRSLNGTICTFETFGLPIYYCPPPKPSNLAVLVVYDVHGFSGGRIKGVCDQIAASGFHVAMLDVFDKSQGINDFGGFSSETGKEWLRKFNWNVLEPQLDVAIHFLKEKSGAKNVGAIGFCWGAWVVFHLSSEQKINAGVCCHPSTRVAQILYNEVELELAKSVKTPMLLCTAKNDPENLKSGGAVVNEIINSGNSCETVEFPDMNHGWVPRGLIDSTNDKCPIARDVNIALDMSCRFLLNTMNVD